jgi:hypothetical protein
MAKRFKDYMEENGTLDLKKPTSEKEPGVYDIENDYVFGFRSATQMLNDLAEKLELLEKIIMPRDREVESQEIMKSTMEEQDQRKDWIQSDHKTN